MPNVQPIIRTTMSPHVGIFWFYRGRLVALGAALNKVISQGGVQDVDAGHDKLWPQVQRRHPAFRHKEYYEVPRGRVLYNVSRGEFWLFAPQSLQHRRPIIDRIIRRFGLPPERIILKSDRHYEPPGDDLWNDEE